MTVEFNAQPDEIMYMSRPDGTADVWLRKDITECETENEDGEAVTYWTAEEVQLNTAMSADEVAENFDDLYTAAEEESYTAEVSDSERLDAIEAALLEITELILG